MKRLHIAAIEYIYIYLLLFILILLDKFIKPRFITKIILYIFCVITTFNTLILCDFSNKDKNKKNIITFLFSLIYPLFWVYSYIVFSNSEKYILLLPILYAVSLRIVEIYFDCEAYHIIYSLLENNNKSKIKFNNIK